MASNVVVAYDNGRRRQTVKTTPMMPLKAIVSAVTEKQRLGPADDFCLVFVFNSLSMYTFILITSCFRYGKHTLDMSLTVRFANLPPGAKLELVKRKATKGK
jgi:tether containing UBX domain for GLUT4